MRPATTTFVTTIGDAESFADCMEHLRAQTVERPIEIIDHVSPMSAAFQCMLDRCVTPFYVQVDEDMMLFPHAVEWLEQRIQQAPPQVAMVCAPLWDCYVERPIQGLKIYRHAIVRQFPYSNTLSCELQQLDRIIAAGFAADLIPLRNGSGGFIDRSACLGEHGKHYTPETIFKRWQRLFQKHQQMGHLTWIEPWPQRLLDRYLESRETLHLYAFLGAVAGIAGDPMPDREVDWREPNAALAKLQRYFPTAPVPGNEEKKR